MILGTLKVREAKIAFGLLVIVLLVFACLPTTSGPRKSIHHSWDVKPGKRSSQKLIIFVHGLGGDGAGTWTNRRGQSWLDLMEDDPAFQDFARVAPSYPCSFSIAEVSEALRDQIQDEGVSLKYKEIYIISHSMGGLVVKRMLATLNRPRESDWLRQFKAAVFISTPSQGAPLADLGSMIGWCNEQVRDLRTSEHNSFGHATEIDWIRLMQDRGHDKFPQAYGAYEKRSLYSFDVVTRAYAASQYDRFVAVDEDHSSIVKPEDVNAPIYKWVRSRIQEAEALAREYPSRLANLIAAKESKRLSENYPLGWALYRSYGSTVEVTTVFPTEEIALRASTGRSYLVSPDLIAIRAPSYFVRSRENTIHSIVLVTQAKEGLPQPFIFKDDPAPWFQVIFRDEREIYWSFGFRRGEIKPPVLPPRGSNK